MGDNNESAGANGGVDEVTSTSVSALFDDTHRKYLRLTRGDEETSSDSVQKKITDLIKKLEDLTRQVSVLGILSDNEDYREINPSELKFIMLPFMIGTLWQLSRAESRENICKLSKVYFKDYLKRCFNYEIILKLPAEAQDEDNDEETEAGSKAKSTPLNKLNSDDVRAMKIQRFKEGKMLEEKIALYLDKYLKEESLDDEDLRKFVVSLLKRNALEAEDQLRSIASELELLKFASKMKLEKGGAHANSLASSSSSHQHDHPHSHGKKDATKKPPQVFILTKNQMEKQVFGAGYPAVPVMTVEELYEQRRKTGQWGHLPSSSANQLPPAHETDDDRDAQQEALEEQDDEELRERQRQMDEYKDDHRRGWGNRYNRS